MSNPPSVSPRWSNTTKLVVALTLVAILAGLIISFRSMLGPLLLSFVLAYLFNPLAHWIQRHIHIPWRFAVTLLYLVGILVVLSLVAIGGIALVDQLRALIAFIQDFIQDLPSILDRLLSAPISIGPFIIPIENLDVTALTNQLLGATQPIISQMGSWLGVFAAGAASTVGWTFFIVLVSYFILVESAGFADNLFGLEIPGYQEDRKRLGLELGRIWNAFLRGQLLVMTITILIYSILLASLGVHYFYGLAILAGLARFVPYVGAWVSWITYGLVSYFQGVNPFNLTPLAYVLLVLGFAWVTDAIIDNLISTRLLADTLKVHPAAVMVCALIALNLLGLVGIVLAAPVMATANLFLRYSVRKLTDQDPWKDFKTIPPPPPLKKQLENWLIKLQRKIGRAKSQN